MCFNLTTLDVLCSDPKARALYLYPTKALAQDQARAIASFRLGRHVRPSIYDGDTKREERTAIRKRSNLILTNPDMLHMGILPNHAAWGDFFANLAVVVVDEAHVYRGVFGSHVGNVLRRLRRIAAAYGTDPRFLLASATIANPVELAEGLTGLDGFAHVERDGSPGAARSIAMWNPPVTDEALQTRRSALGEAADHRDRVGGQGRADDLLREVAQGRRAGGQADRRPAGRCASGAARSGRAVSRGLHAAAAARAGGAAGERRSCSRS